MLEEESGEPEIWRESLLLGERVSLRLKKTERSYGKGGRGPPCVVAPSPVRALLEQAVLEGEVGDQRFESTVPRRSSFTSSEVAAQVVSRAQAALAVSRTPGAGRLASTS
jgi:hypothetical protein